MTSTRKHVRKKSLDGLDTTIRTIETITTSNPIDYMTCCFSDDDFDSNYSPASYSR